MSFDQPPKCFSCTNALDITAGQVGRRDTCNNCGADIRVCHNCKHYELSSYNECREPSAERVVDKDKSNFCDYFLLVGNTAKANEDSKKDALKKLDSLFK